MKQTASSKPRSTPPARPEPSREQVRAWLATVIAPMLRALEVEEEVISQRTWSFRCWSRDFEFLWPTERTVSFAHLPNLRQFWRHHPKSKALAGEHDEALDRLRRSCQEAFEAVQRDPDFATLASQSPDPDSDRRYLAEYVVNGLRDLSQEYSLRNFWNPRGGDFLALRETPALERHFKAVERAGKAFRQSLRRLRQRMESRQEGLSDKHRLPPVDPSEATTG